MTAAGSGPGVGVRVRWGARLGSVVLPAVAAGWLLAGTTACSWSSDPGAAPSGTGVQAHVVGGAASRPVLPPTEAAAGALVPGFPSTLLPLLPGATVTASAVQRHSGVMDVSLSATTRAPAPTVLAFYSGVLGRAGFSQTRGTMLPPGAIGLAFGRGAGQELLVVAVVDRGAVRSFSVGGTLSGSTTSAGTAGTPAVSTSTPPGTAAGTAPGRPPSGTPTGSGAAEHH